MSGRPGRKCQLIKRIIVLTDKYKVGRLWNKTNETLEKILREVEAKQ